MNSILEGRKPMFGFEAADGIDTICKGTHERFIINAEKFAAKLEMKIKQSGEKAP